MTREEVGRLFAIISAEYDTFAVSPERMVLWSKMLEDVSYADGEAAVCTYMAQHGRPPQLADIRRYAMRTRVQLPTAEEAWAEVVDAVDRYGYHCLPRLMPDGSLDEGPRWSSPVVASAVRAIGWQEICLGQPGVIRAHFMRTYDAFRHRAEEVLALGGQLPSVAPANEPVAKVQHWLATVLQRRGHVDALPSPSRSFHTSRTPIHTQEA